MATIHLKIKILISTIVYYYYNVYPMAAIGIAILEFQNHRVTVLGPL